MKSKSELKELIELINEAQIKTRIVISKLININGDRKDILDLENIVLKLNNDKMVLFEELKKLGGD